MSNWEKCVIGTVVNDPEAFSEASELLPSDFTGPNVIVWSEVIALAGREALGLRALTEALRSARDFARFSSDIGTPEDYVNLCLTFRGAEIREYVNQVVNESIRRALQRNMALIAAEAQRENTTADEILDYAERQILNLRRNRVDRGWTLGDLLAVYMPRLHSIIDGTFTPSWTPSVLAVREVVHYAEATDYILIAGRPGDGKSSYLRFEFYNHVMRGGRAAIINMEGSGDEYCRNFLALRAGIDSDDLKTGRNMTPERLEAIADAAGHLARLPLFIKDMGSPSVAEITRYGRKMVAEERVDLLGVDYVQLMNNGIENKVQDVALSSQQLRAFAMNMKVPTFACAQLSRNIEQRGHEEKKPKLSDLRDSGGLEQDGTIVLFPRQEWTNPTPDQLRQFPENVDERGRVVLRPKAVPIKFYIEKNRNGSTGETEPVAWIKSTGNYRTLARL